MPIPARPPRRLDALGDDTEARLAASAGRHAAAIDRAAVPRLPPVSSSRARRLPAVDITTSHASFAVAGSKLGTGSAASVRRSSVRRGTGEGEVRGSIPGGTREHERDAPRAPPSNGGASRLEALRVDASDSRARREAKKRRDARGAAYAWGDGFAGELARFRAEDLAHVGGGTTFTACTTSRGITLELRRRDERPRADVTAHTFKTHTSSEASGETSTSGEGGRTTRLEGLEGLERVRGAPRAPRIKIIAASRCEITDVAVAVCADGSLATISARSAPDESEEDESEDDAFDALCDGSRSASRLARSDIDSFLKPLPVPRRVPGTRELRFKRVACGGGHVLALAGAGDVYAFGANDSGQLGLGHRAPRDSPARVAGGLLAGAEGVLCVAAGDTHSAAVTASGRVYTWGGNERGQLGHGRASLGEDALVPKRVGVAATDTAGVAAVSVACASKAVVAVVASGDVLAWGSGACGALGGGVSDDAPEPRRIDPVRFGNERIVAVSAGHEHFAALAESRRRVFVWGSDAKGQLGSPFSFSWRNASQSEDGEKDGEKPVRAVTRLEGTPPDRDVAFVAAAGDRTFAAFGPATGAARDGEMHLRDARETAATCEDANGPILLPPLLELAETVASSVLGVSGADDSGTDETDVLRLVAAESADYNRVSALLGAVDDVFSSPGFSVDGFSVPIVGAPEPDTTRIDFDAVVSTYDAIVSTYDAPRLLAALLAALADACARASRRLEEILDERHSDAASARVAGAFLILWLSPLHGDPAFRDALLPRLAAIAARLPADALEGAAVVTFARAFGNERRRAEVFATRLAKPVRACVARRLAIGAPERAADDPTDDPALLGLARMLRFLRPRPA